MLICVVYVYVCVYVYAYVFETCCFHIVLFIYIWLTPWIRRFIPREEWCSLSQMTISCSCNTSSGDCIFWDVSHPCWHFYHFSCLFWVITLIVFHGSIFSVIQEPLSYSRFPDYLPLTDLLFPFLWCFLTLHCRSCTF